MTRGSPGQRAGPDPAGGVLDREASDRVCPPRSGRRREAAAHAPGGACGQELGRWAPPTRLSSLQSSE